MKRQKTTPNSSSITTDEAALYDRQIRLWGVEAQNRLRSSHILMIPSIDCGVGSLSGETAKNICLAGIGAFTLMIPEKKLDISDLGCNGFLFLDSDLGNDAGTVFQKSLQKLNPRVSHQLLHQDLETLSQQELEKIISDIQPTTIVLCNQPFGQTVKVDKLLRSSFPEVQLFSGGVNGLVAHYLVDLGPCHEYVVSQKDSEPLVQYLKYPPLDHQVTQNLSQGRESKVYPQIVTVLQSIWAWELKHGKRPSIDSDIPCPHPELLKRLLKDYLYPIPTLAAISGGLLGQDILKAISRKEQVICNCYVMDALAGTLENGTRIGDKWGAWRMKLGQRLVAEKKIVETVELSDSE